MDIDPANLFKMTEQPLQVSIDNHVATITFNRPKRGNSLTPSMIEQFGAQLQKFKNDKTIQIIILTGSGKYFCTGMDLDLKDKSKLSIGKDIFQQLLDYPKPIIAKVNGPALGGGIGIVFCCDVRIVSEKCYFCFAEVKRGLVPALISAIIAPEIGLFKAKQLMLTGEKVSAKRAYEMGFVSQVVKDDEELDRMTKWYVDQLMTSAPEAMAMIKRTLNFLERHLYGENVEYVQKVFGEMIKSKEAQYGMRCFLKKEKPNWIAFHSKM